MSLLSRVYKHYMKLVDSASFQCFTGVSNHIHATKLASLGWTITLWIINSFRTLLLWWSYIELQNTGIFIELGHQITSNFLLAVQMCYTFFHVTAVTLTMSKFQKIHLQIQVLRRRSSNSVPKWLQRDDRGFYGRR